VIVLRDATHQRLGSKAAAAARAGRRAADRTDGEGRARPAGRRAEDAANALNLALISHVLRNALAPMRNALELMRHATDPAEVARHRELIARHTDELAHRLEDLLDGRRHAHASGDGAPAAEGGEGKNGPASPEPAEKPRRRIMVVDDNLDSAETMAELVRIWGYDVRTAHDGPAAINTARAFRPHVVLLDVGLPGMDGYELARRLRAEGLAGDLLVSVTGYGQEDDRRRAEEAGFDHHLTKPVDPDTLLRLVSQA
jgi:CheY-like chemotaxis protein